MKDLYREIGKLKAHGIEISMDGKGCRIDSVFIERLWRSVKYHYLYLWAFENGRELKKGLGNLQITIKEV